MCFFNQSPGLRHGSQDSDETPSTPFQNKKLNYLGAHGSTPRKGSYILPQEQLK